MTNTDLRNYMQYSRKMANKYAEFCMRLAGDERALTCKRQMNHVCWLYTQKCATYTRLYLTYYVQWLQ